MADDRLPFTPASFGLLNTATPLPELERHWSMGLTWEPNCGDASSTWAQCLAVERGSPPTDPGPAGTPEAKAATASSVIRGAIPFTVYVEHDCSAVGGWDRVRKRAADALTRAEGRIVESVFWTGEAAGTEVVFPHLAADAVLIEDEAGGAPLQEAAEIVASPLGIVDALGELEGAIGSCYDGVATIHVPRKLIPRMASNGMIRAQGGLINTTLGTKVAAGRGYPGTGPAGTEAAGVEWMYATGEVFYRRGEIVQPTDVETLNRATNTIKALAERTYVIGWDCCILAIPVTISEGGAS
jgi:hypothetical protein